MNHRIPCRRSQSGKCTSALEVDTRKLQETCRVLYRRMASLWRGHSRTAASGGQEAETDNQSYRTIQLHVETKGISFGQKIALLFQETRQSYWCHQIFSLPLQSRKSITCIALPMLQLKWPHFTGHGLGFLKQVCESQEFTYLLQPVAEKFW